MSDERIVAAIDRLTERLWWTNWTLLMLMLCTCSRAGS